jgi:hypothetical protein
MADTNVPFPVVLFTQQHSISGSVFLRGQRFSDFLNDRREKNVLLRNATVARLENPSKVIEKTLFSFVPKSGILMAFERPLEAFSTQRSYLKHPKNKHDVFLAMDGMEVRGLIHVPGQLDLLNILANSGDSFLPLTQVSVSIGASPNIMLRPEAVIINAQCIRFIGEVESKNPTEPRGNNTITNLT